VFELLFEFFLAFLHHRILQEAQLLLYCLRFTVYWQTIKTGFGYKLTNGWYARSNSTSRVYERTQTQSTEAWLAKVHEVSE